MDGKTDRHKNGEKTYVPSTRTGGVGAGGSVGCGGEGTNIMRGIRKDFSTYKNKNNHNNNTC